MNILEIINKSQAKKSLTKDEIFWLIKEYTNNNLPDYQMSAWLATVFLNPISKEETKWLTEALSQSGEQLTWKTQTVDKHSTGGVGDKTSIIIGPLVASFGYKVPMMAGRGLGHTGGTIDKLESIGFQTDLHVKDFKKLVEKNNLCIIGQSSDFCPADKKMYALRDATHTVANIPLICASIMSKKIAEGLQGLVLDVKFGTGAFMQTLDQAELLSKNLIAIGEGSHIKTFSVLSSMNQPLGRYIGNKLELIECVEILKNPEEGFKKYPDTFLLSTLLSALMIYSLDNKKDLKSIFDSCFEKLMSGQVYDVFLDFISNQTTSEFNLDINLPKKTIFANSDGFMNYTDIKTMGFATVELGAGRFKKEDTIDHNVGLYCYKKMGDKIKQNDPIFDIYYSDETKLNNCLEKLNLSYQIQSSPIKGYTKPEDEIKNLIHKILFLDNGNYKSLHLKNNFFEV